MSKNTVSTVSKTSAFDNLVRKSGLTMAEINASQLEDLLILIGEDIREAALDATGEAYNRLLQASDRIGQAKCISARLQGNIRPF